MIVNNWSLDKFWAFQTNPLLLYTFIFSWWCPLFRLVDLFLPLFPWLGLWSCYIDVHMHKVWYLYVYIHNIIYIYICVCVQLGNITINILQNRILAMVEKQEISVFIAWFSGRNLFAFQFWGDVMLGQETDRQAAPAACQWPAACR